MIKYPNISTKIAFLLNENLGKPMKKKLVVWKERPEAYMTCLLVFLIGTHIQNIRELRVCFFALNYMHLNISQIVPWLRMWEASEHTLTKFSLLFFQL